MRPLRHGPLHRDDAGYLWLAYFPAHGPGLVTFRIDEGVYANTPEWWAMMERRARLELEEIGL